MNKYGNKSKTICNTLPCKQRELTPHSWVLVCTFYTRRLAWCNILTEGIATSRGCGTTQLVQQLRYVLGNRENLFDSRQEQNTYILWSVRIASGVHLATESMRTGASYLGSKAAGTWNLPRPSCTELKKKCSYISTSPCAFKAWTRMTLQIHQENASYQNLFPWTLFTPLAS